MVLILLRNPDPYSSFRPVLPRNLPFRGISIDPSEGTPQQRFYIAPGDAERISFLPETKIVPSSQFAVPSSQILLRNHPFQMNLDGLSIINESNLPISSVC